MRTIDRTIDREAVLDAVNAAGLEEDAIREDYSGRSMYGDECFGIVVDSPGDGMTFAAALATIDPDCVDWIGGHRTDNMGLGTIYYWPGVKLETEEVSA